MEAVETARQLSPAFPPLTGGNGFIFCIGLAFAMMTVAWCASVLIRNTRRSALEGYRFDHPTRIQMRRDAFLYWGFIIGAGYYTVKWLCWGEVSDMNMYRIGVMEYMIRPLVAGCIFLHVIHGSITNIMRRIYGVRTGAITIGGQPRMSSDDLERLMPASMLAELGDYRDPFKSPLVPYAIMALSTVLAVAVSFMKWFSHS